MLDSAAVKRLRAAQAELDRRLDAAFAALRNDGLPDPVVWAERVSGKTLDPWQADFMRWNGTDALLNCARQCGKTEVVSLRAAYRARHLNRVVGCLGPTSRQTSRMFRRAKRWLINDGAEFVRDAGLELELASGGAILAFPGDRPDVSIRGDTLDDAIIDEASVIKDALIAAATPTMATREDRCIVYLSTPMGQRGAFWEAWSRQSWWHKVTVPASQCNRISEAFLERERARLGPLYAQEYECQFLAAPGSLFAVDDLDSLMIDPMPVEPFPTMEEESVLW